MSSKTKTPNRRAATNATTHHADGVLTVYRPRLHEGQARAYADRRRFNVVACGRRWGKSTLATRLLIDAALRDGAAAAYFAPKYKLLLPVWDALTRRLAPTIVASNKTDRVIRLVTGGVIEFWSLEDEDAGRSRAYRLAIIDEAAMVANLDDIWRKSIRATLLDWKGDAWFLSTPRGRDNPFYAFFRRSEDDPAWASFTQPTSANPLIAPEEIEEMKRDIPAHIVAQEIEARFIDDVGALFRREFFRRVAPANVPPGLSWTRGYDLAASTKTSADFTASVAVAVDAATGDVYLRDGFRVRASWNDARRLIIETMRREPKTRHVVEESLHGIAAVQEFLADPSLAGVTIEGATPDRDKYSRALPLAARAEQRRVVLVDGPWTEDWIAEAVAFPGGAHDDYVDAATLAYNVAAAATRRAAEGVKATVWKR